MPESSDFAERVCRSIEASIAVKQQLLSNAEVVSAIATVSQILIEAIKKGNKPLLFGNGGSAADAGHLENGVIGHGGAGEARGEKNGHDR